MAAEAQNVIIYQDGRGREPFSEWHGALADPEAQKRVLVRLNRLRVGNFGDCRPVGDGVLELRVDYGPGYRVYCARDGRKMVVLLCGGDKRTQAADIDHAKRLWKAYGRAT